MKVFSLKGTGLCFCGVSPSSEPRVFFATVWLCFLYLPVLPIRRLRLNVLSQRGSYIQFQTLEKTNLDFGEVLQTYLYGWFLIPLLLLWPLPIAVVEVQAFLGIPKVLQTPVMIFAILWLVVAVWKLKNWDENRWQKTA